MLVLTPRFGGRLFDAQGAGYVHFNVDHVHYFTASTLARALRVANDPAELDVDDVLQVLSGWGQRPAAVVSAKYSTERDSILATAVH
jgi:hypothetical protein